jgi:photosystem II stability/assembly factor-like uncharacterized protein
LTSRTKKQPKKGRPAQAPKRRESAPPSRPWLWALAGAAVVGVIAAIVGVAVTRSNDGAVTPASNEVAEPAAGLPDTPDYHSLSVNPTNPSRVLLGTHQGLFSSSDGGKTWTFEALEGQDAMNLARTGGKTVWTAGHNVFAKSTDGGRTWIALNPKGLPSLDLHGFAVDPRQPRTLYAAVAGQGLYRSTDNGVSFSPISADVGGGVMALAVTSSGDILAGDMQKGLLVSRDGGQTWRLVLRAQLMGLAINPSDPRRIAAAGPGILLSTDGGRSWRKRLEIADGAGPVAWSPSNPRIAYVVGFDQTLYRSVDRGETWSAVG